MKPDDEQRRRRKKMGKFSRRQRESFREIGWRSSRLPWRRLPFWTKAKWIAIWIAVCAAVIAFALFIAEG